MVSKGGNSVKKNRRLPAAIGVSIVAFFELCLTGRADYAWRLARAEHKPIFRKRAINLPSLLLTLLIALVIIIISLSTVPLNRIGQAGTQRMGSSETTMDERLDPPACLTDGPAKAAVIGCSIFTIIV